MPLIWAAVALSGTLSATATTLPIPLALNDAAKCMLGILKATPGVTEARMEVTTDHGRTYPHLEFRADQEDRWVQPFRLEPMNLSGDLKPPYIFMIRAPGIWGPDGPDFHVTDAVMVKANSQCGVHAVYFTM